MSRHVDKAFSDANSAVDGTMDEVSAAGAQVNNSIGEFIQSPKKRQEVYGDAKKSPLTYSFFLFQLLISFVPLSLSVGFVTFSAISALVVAAIVAGIAISITATVLIPVLLVTVPFAAFVWFWVVSTVAFVDWAYRNFYVDTGMQAQVSRATKEIKQEYTEIEENAIKEFESYKDQAIEGGQQAQERAKQIATDIDNKGGKLLDQGRQKYDEFSQKVSDDANAAKKEAETKVDAGKDKASQFQKDGTQFKNDVKHHANGVKDSAKNDFRH